MSIFHLKFPRIQKNFDATLLSFSIGNIKSRVPSVGLIILHCYKYNGSEILVNSKPVHVGQRFVITPAYATHVETIHLTATQLSQAYEVQIELVLFGITSENPCWFNQVMFETGNHTTYHKPAESLGETTIYFNKNNYCVLYSTEGYGLQIIKPKANGKTITTSKIEADNYTILAPHLENEPVTDNPANLMMEFINQTEQYIRIKK